MPIHFYIMESSKKVLVTGITGKQGGAVAQNLLKEDVKIYGLARNPNSKRALEWAEKGIKILQGDLDQPESYVNHLEGMDAIFCIQAFEQGKESEINQGKKLIDAIKNQGVKHTIYSSVLGADLNTGVPHFESKMVLEDYLISKDLPYTILRPASFYENYLNPEITKRLQKGKLVMPLNKSVRQQVIGIDDIGKIAAKVITNPSNYRNKTLSIATDDKTMEEVAQSFENAMNRPIKYQKLPGFLTRLLMGKDLSKMFKYMNRNDFVVVKDIEAIKQEFDGLSNLDQWIHDHFSNS